MVLDQITTVLKIGRPAAKMIPVVGDSLEGALDLAIGICQHAQVRTISSISSFLFLADLEI
jgi:hypothetical protein